MEDKVIISEFEEYMQKLGMQVDEIKYNSKVVKLLSNQVLYVFEQDLATIDTYCFEEFTDMVVLINKELGGREGIRNIMGCMLLLTEFLKDKKYIRGGKIAYYRRMFGKADYYIDKYDMMTGKKDDTKSFIKKITNNEVSISMLKEIEDVNIYDYDTLNKVDKLLNDIPFGKDGSDSVTELIKCILEDLNLIEIKNERCCVTKKGRAFSRLSIEERFSSLMYMMKYCADWINIHRLYGIEITYFEFSDFMSIMFSVFSESREVHINSYDMKNVTEEDMLIEISSDRYRVSRAESTPCGMQLMDIIFIGMGLIDFKTEDNGEIIYSTTPLGQNIIKLMMYDIEWSKRSAIGVIDIMMNNKRYDEAESHIIEYLSTYGPNTKIWCYLGRLLILKKQFKYAYNVLKYAYEKSSKRGKTAKTILYYLVMCCRKLRLSEELSAYEAKLTGDEKPAKQIQK